MHRVHEFLAYERYDCKVVLCIYITVITLSSFSRIFRHGYQVAICAAEKTHNTFLCNLERNLLEPTPV